MIFDPLGVQIRQRPRNQFSTKNKYERGRLLKNELLFQAHGHISSYIAVRFIMLS
jgi:hypothetical protein